LLSVSASPQKGVENNGSLFGTNLTNTICNCGGHAVFLVISPIR
jgi:hypothetical protein